MAFAPHSEGRLKEIDFRAELVYASTASSSEPALTSLPAFDIVCVQKCSFRLSRLYVSNYE